MSKENTTGDGKGPAGDQEEFVMVEVDEQDRPIGGEAAGHDSEDDDDQDEIRADADTDVDEDERVGHSDEEEDAEARRQRRRNDRSTKRVRYQAQGRAKDRLIENQGRMMLDLQEQIAQLQGRSVQYDLNLLQNQRTQIEQQQAEAKAVLVKLSKAQDHEGIAEIVELQMNLRDQHNKVTEQLRRAQSRSSGQESGGEGRPTARRPATPQVDPEVLRRAHVWANQHKWADPKTADPEDLAILRVVDQNLANEGWDPTQDEYWEELTGRVKKRLPHYFKKAAPNGAGNGGKTVNNGNKPANGGPRMAAASQSGGRALGKNEVRVTPDRKKAMQEAGYWDDPVKRNKMLKQYAKYDREKAVN